MFDHEKKYHEIRNYLLFERDYVKLGTRSGTFFFTLYIMFLFCLRIGEIAEENVFFSTEKKNILIIKRKFGVVRNFYCDDWLKEILKSWRVDLCLIPAWTFRRMIKKQFHILPHDIRRIIATHTYTNTKNIMEVQHKLDHRKPETSWVYIQSMQEDTPRTFHL